MTVIYQQNSALKKKSQWPACYPAPICNFYWRHPSARSQQSDLCNGWKSASLAQAIAFDANGAMSYSNAPVMVYTSGR
ncbi:MULTISPECIES: hypothetical protein [Acinetobacter]|jgi:hypothetical protein|uniref:Uncharacterized protein n=1 Tax=Acinetobacter entericus TaxID=2989714 RepID=A0ABT3NLZ4_9GAMM|nr:MULTISPECIES: hypothetical protein [Acinetobacter]MCW8040550.1 hypothetical protein [Acinetobacter entericus]TCB76427.1 hypothetical protein E0H91_03995 [Acinetobacter sp. ANC 4177]